MMSKFFEKNKHYVLPVFTILLLILNSIRIWNYSISGDEGYSIMLAKMPFSEMIQATAADVHPPLYYAIFKVVGMFTGVNAITGRFITFIPAIALAVFCNIYIVKEFGRKAAILMVSLLFININATEMIVEIRMYEWALLLVTLTAIMAYELLKEQKIYKWALLLLFGIAAAYLHYYALIMVFFLFLALFVTLILRNTRNIIPCSIVAVIAVIVYFPWLLILLKQFETVSENFWIANIDLKEWIRYLFGHDRMGRILRAVLVIACTVFLVSEKGICFTSEKLKDTERFYHIKWQFTKKLDHKKLLVLFCGISSLGALLTGYFVSVMFRPLYIERYLYPGVGLIAIAFSISCSNLSKKLRYVIVLVSMIVSSGLLNYGKLYTVEKNYKTEDAIIFFGEYLEPEDIIVTDSAQLSWTVLQYYLPDTKSYHINQIDFNTIDVQTIWYLEENKTLHDKVFEYRNAGNHVEFMADSGIGRYSYSLYRIEK